MDPGMSLPGLDNRGCLVWGTAVPLPLSHFFDPSYFPHIRFIEVFPRSQSSAKSQVFENHSSMYSDFCVQFYFFLPPLKVLMAGLPDLFICKADLLWMLLKVQQVIRCSCSQAQGTKQTQPRRCPAHRSGTETSQGGCWRESCFPSALPSPILWQGSAKPPRAAAAFCLLCGHQGGFPVALSSRMGPGWVFSCFSCPVSSRSPCPSREPSPTTKPCPSVPHPHLP